MEIIIIFVLDTKTMKILYIYTRRVYYALQR